MNASSRSLSNNFQDVRLLSLASWSRAAEFNPRDMGGPYVVIQEGYAPQDPTMTVCEYVLGRSGKWLPLAMFYQLPVPDRRAEFVYGTAAEVMTVVGNLPSKATVFAPGGEEVVPPPGQPKDEMASVIEAKRSGQ